ncbi:unnamed protein product [Fraxinus pennsylvanica]|uniref:Mediator of RNA polymerase II transcription subunit 14 n=1 Tax=Fraxinus pennsylvanica TaxID=56036 RepID=A0AAD2A6A5_9LAMI|nr:unnamed protein product [Fraxinus pennsylvanica]
MGELGQETVDFKALVGRAATESYVLLKELVEKSKSAELSDSEKKIMILKYIVKTQQRMLRLNVLSKWCQQVPLIRYCQQLASTLSSHDTCFTQAADSMFFMHEGLQQARAPIYDVPSAIEVLLTGTYQRLPKCIEDVGTQGTLNADQQSPALRKLDALVRSKLLEVSLPREITEVKVSDGVALLRVDGEFKVLVTLGYRGHLSMWRILHLELLVGEKGGHVKLEESRRRALGDDFERRMAASENPFMTLYSILHELCVALVMDTVIRQVQALRQGRWKDAIRFELISDGSSGQGGNASSTQITQDGETDSASLRTPGLKVIYWLDYDKNSGTSGTGTCPYMKIEPGPDLQIKCLHSTFVIDPLTGREAEFSLNQSCIDVEMLLLRAIYCNKYTRLLEICKELEKNDQIWQAPGDVQLQFCTDECDADNKKKDDTFSPQKYEGGEVLCVRAYGSSFFTLGINIRNGRFLLHSSKNIISSSVLLECEEALNQGSMTATKTFINLRSSAILHLFACIGRFLGLEVFEHGFTPVKVPKNISDGSNSLILGFPECGSSYFLLMQLDKEFKPLLKLIEAQADSIGKGRPIDNMNNVIRVNNVDISQMNMCEDELNLSLLDHRKILTILSDVDGSRISERGPSDSSNESFALRPNLPLSFSSIVDEVFELEKGSNAPSFSGHAEANKGNAPSSIYVSVLLHVVRHCSLCIKHARLTSQMDALDLPYVEEVGLRSASSNLWFRLPFASGDTWQYICLRLGRPGSMYWDVKIIDPHFKDLWELQKGSNNTAWGSGVRIANTSDVDSHIRYDSEGVVLSYNHVEADSIKKLVADIQRLSNARMFALGMRKLLGARTDEKLEESPVNPDSKPSAGAKSVNETPEKFSEQMRRVFRIEAVGLMSLWFSFGSGVLARFVIEWEAGKEGCTMHVSPDQLWPHTKFLEDFINGAEVASLLDCIRLTAGPLHALAAATRPARAAPVSGVPGVAASFSSTLKQSGYIPSQGHLPSNSNTNTSQASSGSAGNLGAPIPSGPVGSHSHHTATMLAAAAAAAAGRGGSGIVPSSLLPIDVSVVLRGPYWIRIIYRKNFAVDMRCYAGDQVWLQPATPPRGGPSVGGSLPCPQFRPFIMEHVAQELNGIDSNFPGAQQALGLTNLSNPNPSSVPQLSAANGNRTNLSNSAAAISRPGNAIAGLNRLANALPGPTNLAAVNPLRRSPGSGVPAHVRGELNTAIIGLGDDGGYGGGWVPVVALKKVLRGILKYLGVLWLFAQLPDLLREILGSILKDNEGALLNLDQEQPALRFFVGGYVFAVSVHRVQLLLQVLSVKRFHHSQQQQQNAAAAQEELTQSEIGEICDYFSRRVASEPYDASRVASFITLLTLPISVLREFLKLIAWKKGLAQGQGNDIVSAQKSRIELCLENHVGFNADGNSGNSSASKSNIQYDRAHNSVDFALTVVLDPAHIPPINAAGGAAWLPYCVSVRLRYSFGENPNVSFVGMEGSHGGRACWMRIEDWDKCKQRVARTVEVNGSSGGDANQGRLRVVADSVQRTLHVSLQGLRDGIGMTS